ncbi:MAG TPA: SBBP repeat-containing protein [Chloroflexia bacterium]|jgi:hypothetical protein
METNRNQPRSFAAVAAGFKGKRSILVLAFIALVLGTGVPFALSTLSTTSVPSPAVAPPNAAGLARLPIAFEPNAGQTDRSVRFMAHIPGGALFFAPSEVVLSLFAPTAEGSHRDTGRIPGLAAPLAATTSQASGAPGVLRVQFRGTDSAVRIVATDDLAGRVNYLLGSDPAGWHTGIPTYRTLTYQGLYRGVDLSYNGTGARLKGTYTVAAGADPSSIRWGYEGANGVSLDPQGNLVVAVGGMVVTEAAPIAWQASGGQRDPVAVSYLLHPDGTVGFALGNYDPTRPLVLDPTLTYSTYLGGTAFEMGYDIAVDAAGNAYVTGVTESTNFPTANAIQATNAGSGDVFVIKLNAEGSGFVYSTYLGGSNFERGYGIAVDGSGNVYVTGDTTSTDFPTLNPIQATNAGNGDVFVSRLNAEGSALVYSTYLGGSGFDTGSRLEVDGAGNVYIAGSTESTDFPTANAIQAANGGGRDAVVSKLNAAGSAFVYSTYLGGSGFDEGNGIAIDTGGNAYVTGSTASTNFPTLNAIQANNAGDRDAFASKLNAKGSALVYSTYLGGSSFDECNGIAVDAAGSAYVTGMSQSTDFPTANAIQAANAGGSDAFVSKLNAEGSALVYSTYLGGSSSDAGNGIAVDAAGNAHATGYTQSTNFPTVNSIQDDNAGGSDVFATELNAEGSALVHSTYLGGDMDDNGNGIAVDAAGNAYLTGDTQSANFPTANPLQAAYGGGYDGFVAKIAGGDLPPTSTATNTPTSMATATPTGTACSVSFSDEHPGSSTFYSYVQCLACRGIVTGYSDGTFREGDPITRGQIAKIVSNAADFNEDPGDQVYSDVPPGSPFYAYINRLTNRGIVGGYPCPTRPGGGDECTPENPGLFKPNEHATRGQLAKIVSNAAGFSEAVSGQHYADVPAEGEGSQFYEWIMRLTGRYVMGGYPCGTADPRSGPCDGQSRPYFRPGNTVTRGQAAKIVANTFFPNCETLEYARTP